jgi:hypothetical protein
MLLNSRQKIVAKTTCSHIATNRKKQIILADIDVPYPEVFLNLHWCPQQNNKSLSLCDRNVGWDTTFPSNRSVRYGLSQDI